MHPRDQTIFALSSGRLPSAIAVVRVSGPQAGSTLTWLAGKIPIPRRATRALLHDARQQPIDDAVVLWFPEPASATGEDVAEFHVHGGRAVVASLLGAISAIENVRAAEPGEFTRRAFENGKLDLTEAEGLDDLIRADTDRQRRQALRQLQGVLGDRARDWRGQIIEACALIEAGIDFADEGDVPAELIAPAVANVTTLLGEIQHVPAGTRESKSVAWLVRNKSDLDAVGSKALSRTATQLYGANGQGQGEPMFAISASRGDGIAELISALVGFAQEFFGATENALISRIRQRELLQQTAASLQRSLAVIGEGEELAAEDLRAAAYSLGRLLGRVDVEDILDVIFREFCIGK